VPSSWSVEKLQSYSFFKGIGGSFPGSSTRERKHSYGSPWRLRGPEKRVRSPGRVKPVISRASIRRKVGARQS